MTARKAAFLQLRDLCCLKPARRSIQKAGWAVNLLGKSFYWGWAARQEMSDEALLDRLTGPWGSVGTFLEHLSSRPGSSWLLPHGSPERAAELLCLHYRDYILAVKAAAEAACVGEFNLIGHFIRYPNGVDWHRDPLSEWRWPVLHRGRLDRLVWSPNPPADLTLVWELNRHQHFSFLGIAYWITRDERYAETFVHQVQSWVEQNPLQHGIHWHSSLEVALRVIAWTVAFQFFRNSTHVQGQFGAAFFKSLYQQVDFVREHLQTRMSTVPNNHLIAELAGIVIAGAVFPEFKEAGSWRSTGLEMLAEHIVLQTHGDGVNKEQATGYHRFVAELLCILVALGRRGLLPRAPILEETLEKMLDYLQYSTNPAGQIPHWGDCGYTRALGMEPGEDYQDSRWLLAAGAVLFQRPDWKLTAGEFGAQAFWLLGEEGLEVWERLPEQPPASSSRAFPDGGMYILRGDWATNGDLMFFRCGPFGLGIAGKCSHAHCDLLSPLLWIQGRRLLVDPGTYTYSGPWRNPFRLTAAHNTLVVDRYEQAAPLDSFGWICIPQAACLEWVEGQRVVGGLLAAPGVYHTREAIHLAPGIWQINDRLEGEGCHHLAWNFLLAPELSLRWIEPYKELIVEENGSRFALILPPASLKIEAKTGWFSRNYGYKEPAPLIEGNWWGEFTAGSVTFSWEFVYAGEMFLGEFG